MSNKFLTIEASKDSLVIGNTIQFSGISENCGKNLHLLAFGEGDFLNGKEIAVPEVDDKNYWKYTWDPGYNVLPGKYSIKVIDSENTISNEIYFCDDRERGCYNYRIW